MVKIPKNLLFFTRTRKEAELEAKDIRSSFRSRGITKRKIIVKPVSRSVLKRLSTTKVVKQDKKKRFGIFISNKVKRRAK